MSPHVNVRPAAMRRRISWHGAARLTALAPDFQVVAVRLTQASDIVVTRAESLLGSRGTRIDRPPRNLLSL